jgi:hypothetical protein
MAMHCNAEVLVPQPLLSCLFSTSGAMAHSALQPVVVSDILLGMGHTNLLLLSLVHHGIVTGYLDLSRVPVNLLRVRLLVHMVCVRWSKLIYVTGVLDSRSKILLSRLQL